VGFVTVVFSPVYKLSYLLNGQGFRLVIKKSWFQLPAFPLSCNESMQVVQVHVSITKQYNLEVAKWW